MQIMPIFLGESMSRQDPKTLEFASMPNCTFENRKLTPLGAMFKNGVKCNLDLIAFNDSVQSADQQHRKKKMFLLI